MRRKSGLSPALFIASGFMGGLAVPDAPALTAPANAAVLDDTTPEFSWQAVPGAVTYDIEIRATLTGTPTATGIAVTTYTPSALDVFTTYSWRVRAVNAVGAGAWSAARTFTLYGLLDEFWTTETAPLASPRTADPAGQVTLVQTDGQMSIEYGLLGFPAQSTAAYGDQGAIGQAVSRKVGRVWMLRLRPTASGKRFYIMWGDGTSVNFANMVDTNAIFTWDNIYIVTSGGSGPNVGAALAADTEYRLAIRQRTNGYDYFIRGGAFITWTRIWIETTGNTAVLYPTWGNYDTAGKLKGAIVKDLSGVLATDVDTELSVSSPVTGQDYEALADGIFDLTVTAPNPLGTGSAAILYRYQDAQNYWHLYLWTDGKLYLDSVIANTRTNRTVSAAAAVAVGQTVTIRVIADGTKHRMYRKLPTGVWNYLGAEVDLATAFDAEATVRMAAQNGYTASVLDVWHRDSANITASLDEGFKRFFPIGDSKTAVSTYPQHLEQLLTNAAQIGEESPQRVADNGQRVSTTLPLMDAALAKVTDSTDYILINFGINDIGNGDLATPELQSTFVTNYQSLIDKCNTKWPSAKVGLMRPGGRNYDTDTLCDTLLPQVIAGRAWASLGPDERVFLEGGDDYATYTSDGVHPNEAGRVLTAQQWKTWIDALT